MVEGKATKEVEPRLPRLPNGWLSCQSRKSRHPSLYVILVQDNNGGDPDLLLTGEIGPGHQRKIRWGFRILKVQCEWKP